MRYFACPMVRFINKGHNVLITRCSAYRSCLVKKEKKINEYMCDTCPNVDATEESFVMPVGMKEMTLPELIERRNRDNKIN